MIHFGIDILLKQNPSWKKKRIGLVTNHAATTNKLIPSRKALLDKGFNIIKLFSPEHGLDVKGADGAKMKDGIDALSYCFYNQLLQGKSVGEAFMLAKKDFSTMIIARTKNLEPSNKKTLLQTNMYGTADIKI
jgi:uncharacterized protein YbbC (DUF1343 family)